MANDERPNPNNNILRSRTQASAEHAADTNAAERAKTTQKNQINGYPSWADKNGMTPYAPHVNPAQLDRAGGVTGPPIVGSWEPMNNPDGSFNPKSSQRPIPPKLQESIYSPHIQGQLDAAAGMTRSPIAGTSQLTPYGTASSTFSNAPQTEPQKIMDGKTQIGISHPAAPQSGIVASDPIGNAQARLALQQQHPEVFQAGTPKNQAFIDYAHKYGEAAAHQNIGMILGTSGQPTTGASPAMAHNDMPSDTTRSAANMPDGASAAGGVAGYQAGTTAQPQVNASTATGTAGKQLAKAYYTANGKLPELTPY